MLPKFMDRFHKNDKLYPTTVSGLLSCLCTAYMLWELDQLFIKRHHTKDLKWTKFGSGPIQTGLEAFLGFLGKTKIKYYPKLTVVMLRVCYQQGLPHLVLGRDGVTNISFSSMHVVWTRSALYKRTSP